MLSSLLLIALATPAPQLPFSKYTDADWPNGVDLGRAAGVSFGDYDGDGFADLFVCDEGMLWRNLGGQGWAQAHDLAALMSPSSLRYGSAFGDFNRDGFPDIATEPRKYGLDDCLHIFENLGGSAWTDIAIDPLRLDVQPCGALAETAVWVDFDGDHDLDLFLPTYPDADGSIDNQFLHNLGPTGPGGSYRFSEKSAAVGVKIPVGAARPEGVVQLDLDGDGDIDLYSNGHWYRNVSQFDAPAFEVLTPRASGVKKETIVDEGTVAVDYDLDGDLDLLVSYTFNRGNRLWVNRGDGTFFEASTDVIDDFQAGSAYGISAIDWDNDGDLDFTANDVFRESQMMDSDEPEWKIVSSPIPDAGAPAWADWDRDGDMDFAAGDGRLVSFLWQNDLYGPNTPLADKRYVRVRVVDDSATVPRGLETEYGATVELVLRNAAPGKRFVQLVSSAAGYINQNEYALHFGLPADPEPANPNRDLRFDLIVDFPSLPELGFHRVDKRVNPALANLDLAWLSEREITVYRSGRVRFGGAEYMPVDPGQTKLLTTTGGLAAPEPDKKLPPLTDAASGDEYVGIELDTIGANGPQRLVEVLLDGQPGDAVDCGGSRGNLAVWDVTQPAAPQFVGALTVELAADNRRSVTRSELVLQPNRIFRIVARVQSYRPHFVPTPWIGSEASVNGGLLFTDQDPCSGLAVAAASLRAGEVYLAARLRPQDEPRWFDLGHSMGAGSLQAPLLTASGLAQAGETIELEVTGAPPLSEVRVLAGARLRPLEQRGAVVHPDGSFRLRGTSDAQGRVTLSGVWPEQHAPGVPVFFQALVGSAGSPIAASQVVATLGEARR